MLSIRGHITQIFKMISDALIAILMQRWIHLADSKHLEHKEERVRLRELREDEQGHSKMVYSSRTSGKIPHASKR